MTDYGRLVPIPVSHSTTQIKIISSVIFKPGLSSQNATVTATVSASASACGSVSNGIWLLFTRERRWWPMVVHGDTPTATGDVA